VHSSVVTFGFLSFLCIFPNFSPSLSSALYLTLLTPPVHLLSALRLSVLGIDFSKTDLFVGLSFDTISATGANGAVIHYKPEKETCATVDPKKIYLCDSGAQFRYLSLPVAKYFTFPHLNPVLLAHPLPSSHIILFTHFIQFPRFSKTLQANFLFQRWHNRHNPHNNLLSPYTRTIPRLHPRPKRAYRHRPLYLPEIDHRFPN